MRSGCREWGKGRWELGFWLHSEAAWCREAARGETSAPPINLIKKLRSFTGVKDGQRCPEKLQPPQHRCEESPPVQQVLPSTTLSP